MVPTNSSIDGLQTEARKVILVVEDNEIVSSLIKVVLEDDYHIEIRKDGREALNYLDQGKKPVLILLDMLMPVMNGGTFIRRFSENPGYGRIPIIFITTVESKRLMNKFKDMVVGYIEKPFKKEELITKVKEAVN
jgi:CheY-like chemotaxis protein